MKIIIRLECSKYSMHSSIKHIHKGCYSGTGIAEMALDAVSRARGVSFCSSDMAHPTPDEEGMPWHSTSMCAFSSYAMFRQWFPYDEGLKGVADIARVAVYSVPDECLIQGKCQVMVESTKVTLIKVLPTTCTADDVLACIQEVM